MVQRTEGKGEVGCIKIGKNALEWKEDVGRIFRIMLFLLYVTQNFIA